MATLVGLTSSKQSTASLKSNPNSLKTQSVMAFNNLLVCAVLATAIYCATAAPTTATYKLLSERSGLFVEALANGDVRATASATGKCMHAVVHMHACDKIMTFRIRRLYIVYIYDRTYRCGVRITIAIFLFSYTVPAARFYVTWPSPGKIRFESAEYSGKYLLVQDGVLKAGVPSNDNDLFSITNIDTATFAFHISPDCYMAFDHSWSSVWCLWAH